MCLQSQAIKLIVLDISESVYNNVILNNTAKIYSSHDNHVLLVFVDLRMKFVVFQLGLQCYLDDSPSETASTLTTHLAEMESCIY